MPSSVNCSASRSTSSADRARRQGDLAGVQAHVAALDPFRRQRPQCSQILRQTDAGDDLRQLLRALDLQQGQAGLGGRVDACGAADRPDGQRQLQLAFQCAIFAGAPSASDVVASGAGCEGMRPRSTARAVVAVAISTAVDAVQDALVVRRRPG